ncbi:MAG: transporter [Paenibacillus sp.]|jgi:phosphoserine aminotransferase|nr:transporter [Paenibacillus sp.]
MHNEIYNFYAGPAVLPLEVLQQAQAELLDYKGIGMSIMEISHRSKEYEEINSDTQDLFRELLQLPDDYKVLFLQGGASTQFSMIPMNFLSAGKVGSYIMTGAWAEKAIQEARKFGEIHIAASGQSSNYKQIPTVTESQLDARAAYLHITTNETIIGSQFHTIPYTGAIPLIADMSSDILSRPIDASRFALIYAGAQKNLGPSGVTVVIIRSDLAQKSPVNLPEMLKYDTHIKSSSLYNTPPVFSVYIMNLVLKWIKQHGGLGTVNLRNHEKVKLIYDVIDQSGGFYEGLVETDSRSLMNITFKVMNDEVEKEFLSQAEQQGFIGLQGHRSVGHIRASTYNALPYEACKALADFMATFLKRYG